MKRNLMLTIMSLLSILFMTIHLAYDILYGMSPAGLTNLIAVAIFFIWLYGTLELAEKRLGYIIMLLGSLLGMLVPYIHMRASKGVLSGDIANSSGAFFFVWTLLALGVTSVFSVILSARGLWSLRSGAVSRT